MMKVVLYRTQHEARVAGTEVVGWLAAFGLAVVLGALVFVAPGVVSAQTRRATPARAQKLPAADKIVGEYLKAVGGKKRVAAIRDATYEWSVQRGATATTGTPAETARTQHRAPSAARTDIVLSVGEINAAASAQSAWTRDAGGGLRTLVGNEASASKLQATLDASGLVNYRKLNVLARTVALDNTSGEAAYVVEFSTREGARLRYWFAAASKLLVQVEDVARQTTRRFADYRRTDKDGVLEPHRIEVRREGAETLTLVLESVRYNTGLASSIFDPPGEPGLNIETLLREVASNQFALDARVSEYTFTRRETEREINDKGELKKEKVVVHEVYPVPGGGRVLKLISENGQPLTPEATAKEEKRVAEELEKAEREYEKRKQKQARGRIENAQRRGNETGAGADGNDDIGIGLFLSACEFVAPRRERFGDRDAIVFDFRPRQDFRPSNRGEEIISKLTGVMWIDPVDRQVMRLEARLSNTIKVGGGLLASIRPGSTFAFEQTRLPDGVWLPRFSQISASAKLFLIAGFRIDATREYGDYRRFTTKSGDAVLDAPAKP